MNTVSTNPDDDFLGLVVPHKKELRLHCYRMLGSSHDTDDVLQETLIRAWRAKSTLKDRAMLRPWLYRIATNLCLDEIKRRPRRALSTDSHPAAEYPLDAISPQIKEPVWLEPMPDSWLAETQSPDPSARYSLKESVALAFVAMLQMLSAEQRATLLLRDVVGLSAEEAADALGLSVSAANSALFRARTAVEKKIQGHGEDEFSAQKDAALVARYVRAFEVADVDALVAILHDEVVTTMPPSPTWIDGREANIAFYKKMLLVRGSGYFRALVTGINGKPGLAFYRPDAPGEPHTLHAIQSLEIRDDKIFRIDHFMMHEVFRLFDVPEALPARALDDQK